MCLKSTFKLAAAFALFFTLCARADAQEEETPKYEVGAQFSTIGVGEDGRDIPGCLSCDAFFYKGSNGRWRDVLTAEQLARYQRRIAEVLTPTVATWLEHGRLGAQTA